MADTLKIAVPMAGLGSRMRPHTWSKPKPLIAIAGKTVLDYVLEQFNSLPKSLDVEYIFIIGPNQREQVEAHMRQNHPEKKAHYVIQEVMRGQSDALYLAREYLHGPMLMAFSDTLIETDLSRLDQVEEDGLAWVKPVEDPRRFGVAVVDEQGWVTRLVEKPQDVSNNLVVVGFYYFKRAEDLLSAIEEQFRRNLTLKNEFFLADAVNILLERGARMRTRQVEVWLDAGIPDAVLETNRYLLEHGYDNSASAAERPQVTIIPPVFVHPAAQVRRAVIGPHVSIGKDCVVEDAVIRNSIVDEASRLQHKVVSDSIIGRQVVVEGRPVRLNVGDNSWLKE
ncbi:MAG: sugar phosphate nucleotidyltransferase [Chloroflexota bacterium]